MPPIRPVKATGAAPSTASRTSSTIWPADSSTTRMPRTRPASSAMASRRERPQRDRPEEAGPEPVGARLRHGRARDPRGGAVGDDHELGVVEVLAGMAHLALRDRGVLRLQVPVVRLEVLGLEVERPDDARRAPVGAGQRPVGGRRAAARGRPARPAPSPGPGSRRRGSSPASGSARRARRRRPMSAIASAIDAGARTGTR